MVLADRLTVPDRTVALLFDMDGVLLDTLTMEYGLINDLLARHVARPVTASRALVRSVFPYDVPEAWRRMLSALGLDVPPEVVDRLVSGHEEARHTTRMPVHEGIEEILAAARAAGLAVTVVSNNPEDDVASMLAGAGLRDSRDGIVGNDTPGLEKKPAPDTYREAARRLQVDAAACVVVEDSLVGAEAGTRAGCHTVGVATGANAFAELSESAFTARTYTRFVPGRVRLELGDVTAKALDTPNDFVSHMIEHVAWRLGCSVELLWTSDDWRALGAALGGQIGVLPRLRESAAALGMIDDGSCLVELTRRDGGGTVALAASGQVDLAWFLGLRCEQLANGGPLVSVLEGLAEGSGWDMRITVASLEDAHHTWEGIFRGVGIALHRTVRAARDPARASAPDGHGAEAAEVSSEGPVALPGATDGDPAATNGDGTEPRPPEARVERGWRVHAASPSHARLRRETAESAVGVEVAVALGEAAGARCRVDVADSINVAGVEELLDRLAVGAGLGIAIDFRATRLSSSHVVLEDIGLALGRALRLLAVERMESTGIEGAGSNVDRVESLVEQPIRVGVSMEGRKFWRFVPLAETYDEFRRGFLLGHTLPSGLFSEDLDDFVDGLAGGLQASVMVHVAERVEPETGWAQVFSALGEAIGELLSVNESRRSLTPGVKATLA